MKDILELEITMDDALAVDIGDGETKLSKDPSSFRLCKHLVFDQVVVQLAACAEFADHPDVLFSCDYFIELHDIGVVKATMVVNLACEAS